MPGRKSGRSALPHVTRKEEPARKSGRPIHIWYKYNLPVLLVQKVQILTPYYSKDYIGKERLRFFVQS
jgi:hypothetical protein